MARFLSAILGILISQTSNSSLAAEISQRSVLEELKQSVGITYFTYFYGPGLGSDTRSFSPNQLGKPQNDGLYLQNQVSFRYKFSNQLALDLQSRFNLVLNNYAAASNYSLLRWESPRIGISGSLLSGENWTLRGAVNTDFPYFFPEPFSGYQSKQRRVIFTPGMFAAFSYRKKGSRWSIFSVVSPRYFFYADRDAAEPQQRLSGMTPGNKPELILAFQPTLNYKIIETLSLTLGTTLDYRKQVLSDWNLFRASLISNGNDPAWRLSAIPLSVGITWELSSTFRLFPYVTSYPVAIQRKNLKAGPDFGKQASFLEATSVGMWVSGTLF